MCFKGKYQFLGTFTSPEEAAKAYDRAVLQANPRHAILNFPSRVQSRSRPKAQALLKHRVPEPKTLPSTSTLRTSGSSLGALKPEVAIDRRAHRAERRAKRSRTASDTHGARSDTTFRFASTPNRAIMNNANRSLDHSPSGASLDTQSTSHAAGAYRLLSWNEYQKLHSGKHSRVLSREYQLYKKCASE